MSSHRWPGTDGGTGDVSGPSSSTDNAVPRYDGTTGKLLQDSGVIIDDSDNITGVNNLTVEGDLTVNGTTTTINTATLDVEDANITVNNGGNQATANSNVAGFKVEMSDATHARVGYDSSLASKFKAGEEGAESQIATVSHTQTLINKSIDADNNTLSNIANAQIKAAAAIAVNKLAALTASRAVATDGSGFLTTVATTATELGYVNGVTSGIQSQLNGKEPTVNLTANRAVVSNGSGALAVAATTATEIGYVNGVTSGIQGQLNTLDGRLDDAELAITTAQGDINTLETDLAALDGEVTTNTTEIDTIRAVRGNVAVAGNVTLTNERCHFVDTSAARTLTLPAPAAGLFIVLKDSTGNAQTNPMTVNPAVAQTIDGDSSLVIDWDYGSVTIVSDGSNYFVI